LNETKIYLDCNATAPIRPQVIEVVSEAMATVGNASSVHAAGRLARKRVEEARAHVAALVGASADNVIFTSGGTEADNLALRGFGDRRLIVSQIEHGAILAPSLLHGADTEVVPVDADGLVDLAALEEALASEGRPALVSIMLANNETGVIQPVRKIADLAHKYGALMHTDAVQAAGKIPVSIDDLGVDLMSVAAHKIGGPQGIGALVMREDRQVEAQVQGGGQERGRRSGTENVAGCAGFGEAARLALAGLDGYAGLAGWRDDMERRIGEIAPARVVFGQRALRLPNTSCITMPGVKAEIQLMLFDQAGFAVGAGSACSSGKVTPSHVLDAMGVDAEQALTAIRVSLGWNTTAEDVSRFVDAWADVWSRQGGRADAA
jgi:cysteine desulfurase